jgi:mannose-6-phosphate isomerase-like protein (cupin superfamily)
VTRSGTDIASTTDHPEGGVSGETVAAARFRPISNPATSERIQFTTIGQDDGEDIVRFNWRSMPGGAITEHVHPHQEERFTIIAGEAHFTLDGEERVVGPGETIVVPVGVRHSESNPGSVEIEGVVELRPALHSKDMHEAFAGLGSEGKTTPRGAPKNPLQLGATVWHFRHESRATSPPIWVQNLVLPPLSLLAKVFGVHPYYERWDTRNSGSIGDKPVAERLDTDRPSSPPGPVNH